ncbi:MAG: XrtA-associated tyrosine autokinase [Nitrosomonas sp.]|nr:XrtA-associated tyrosine autokinase [Nitrosomonas sp.]
MSLIERAADKLAKSNTRQHLPGTDPGSHPSEETLPPNSASSLASPTHDVPTNGKQGHQIFVATAEQSSHLRSSKATGDARKTTKRIDIDLENLHRSGIVTLNHTKSAMAEQFRLIKRPLLSNAFNQMNGLKNGNLIMVTSSLAGEGKSFCSINLAMSIAMEMDHRVLLVDADVARPSIPRTLGFSMEEPGLLDIILNPELDIADVMIKTNVEKLTLLPAGTRHTHATELLASQSMGTILQELAQRYHDRIVIFDSPPLLLTSEARALACQMGQIVLVVEAERTTQQTVKDALQQIESCDVVNLIYNKARSQSNAGYYGYYY